MFARSHWQSVGRDPGTKPWSGSRAAYALVAVDRQTQSPCGYRDGA